MSRNFVSGMLIDNGSLILYKSVQYLGRYECCPVTKRGDLLVRWIKNKFGAEDDMVHYCIEHSNIQALITEHQLTLLLLAMPDDDELWR